MLYSPLHKINCMEFIKLHYENNKINNDEFEEFTEWSKSWYPIIIWKDYRPFDDKFIPNEFFDQLGIQEQTN